jgi:hypothetical protein
MADSKSKHPRREGAAQRVTGLAEVTASRSALLLPWRELQNQMLRYAWWYEFTLWARAIEETAGAFPEELQQALNARCPGFLDLPREQGPPASFPWLALMSWVHARHFQEAMMGGWFAAVTYYAERHWIVRSAWRLWEQHTDEWCLSPPASYPSFEEWQRELRRRFLPDGFEREVEALVERNALLVWFDLVSASGTTESVARSLEREWVRLFSSSCPDVSQPGHLQSQAADLMDHQVQDAVVLAAIKEQASTHLRALRVTEYAERCAQEWREARPSVYPEFHEWSGEVDAFVDPQSLAASPPEL